MARKKSARNRRDIYQEVTETILGYLDQGVAPWRNPIARAGGGGQPMSLASKKPYRGINTFLLAMVAWAREYSSDYWLTYNHAKKSGCRVRKGEKGTLVVFWKHYAKTDKESGEEVTLPVLRHYFAFNADQVEGIVAPDSAPPEPDRPPFVPIAAAEQIVAGYRNPPEIIHRKNAACYLPSLDRVEIAEPMQFESQEAFYATLYHELTHSSGHKTRLDRGIGEKLAPFGSPDYSKEELVAEFGGAFLAAAAGISPPTIEQSAAYIEGWRSRLSADKKMVIQAAGLGQRAADHILGVRFDDESNEPGSAQDNSLAGGPSEPRPSA